MEDGTGPVVPKDLKRTTSMSKKVAKAASSARKSLTSPLRRRPSSKSAKSGLTGLPKADKAEDEMSEVSVSTVDAVVSPPAAALPADFAPNTPKKEEEEVKPAEPPAPVMGIEVPPTIVEMVAELEKEMSISSPKATSTTALAPAEKMDLHPLLRMLFKVTCTEMCFTEVEPVKALPAAVSA